MPGVATSLLQVFGGTVPGALQEAERCKRASPVGVGLVLHRALHYLRLPNSRQSAFRSVDSRQDSPELRQPTQKRQSKSVSCCCLQRKPILRFRHQWESRLVGLPARVKESLSTRQLHQPIFADKIVDNLGRLLSEGRVEGQPIPNGPALKHRPIRRRLAPGQQRPLPRNVREGLGRRVVCCPKPKLGVGVIENLLCPRLPKNAHQVRNTLERKRGQFRLVFRSAFGAMTPSGGLWQENR